MFAVDIPEFSAWQMFLSITLFLGSIATMLAFGKTWIVNPIVNKINELMDEKLEDNRTIMNTKMDERLAPVYEKLEDVEADVADIRHEVNTNNGQSLKDVAIGTRQDVAVLKGRFEDHLAQHQGEQ